MDTLINEHRSRIRIICFLVLLSTCFLGVLLFGSERASAKSAFDGYTQGHLAAGPDGVMTTPGGGGGTTPGGGGTTPGGGGTTPGGGGTTPGGGGTTPPNELKNPLQSKSIEEFLLKIIEIILVFAVPVIVFFIIYGGFLLVTARGDEGQVTTGRNTITWAVIGGVIVLGAQLIITVIQGTVDSL